MRRIPSICDKKTFYYRKILQNNEANALNEIITGIVNKKHALNGIQFQVFVTRRRFITAKFYKTMKLMR